MEGIVFDIDCFDPMHLTFYSDIHGDAAACAHTLLKADMDTRAGLPNSLFIGNGDLGNYVMPGDVKRYMMSVPDVEFRETDDYLGYAQYKQKHYYSRYPFISQGDGNHEHSVLKHHKFDIVNALCQNCPTPPMVKAWRVNDSKGGIIAEYDRSEHKDGFGVRYMNPGKVPIRMGIPHTRYVSMITLRFWDSHNAKQKVNILMTHGRWGGAVVKGMAGAERFLAGFDDIDLLVFGHNHHSQWRALARLFKSERNIVKHNNVYILNTGGWQRSYTQGKPTDYVEIAGHPPVPLGTSTVLINPNQQSKQIAFVCGDVRAYAAMLATR